MFPLFILIHFSRQCFQSSMILYTLALILIIYKLYDPYDDWIFRQLADIDNRNNIPNTSPQLDFNETDYEDYLKEKWNRGL